MTDDHSPASGAAPSTPAPRAGARGGAPVDLAGLAAMVRSIERGENPSAPAPRGDAAQARRKRREAMAAEAAALQAAEAAEAAEAAGPAGAAGAATETGSAPDAGDSAQTGATSDPDREPADDGTATRDEAAGTDDSGPASTPDPAPAGSTSNDPQDTADDGTATPEEAAGTDDSGPASTPDPAPAGSTSNDPQDTADDGTATSDKAAGTDGSGPNATSAPAPSPGADPVQAAGTSTGLQGASDGGTATARAAVGGADARAERRGAAAGQREPGGVRDTAEDSSPETAYAPGAAGASGRGPASADTGAASPRGAVGSAAAGDGGTHVRDTAADHSPATAPATDVRVDPGQPDRTPGGRAPEVDAAAVAEVRDVLVKGGAPGELAEAAVRVLGGRAAGELRGDPWLVLGLGGVRVADADAFARGVLGGQCGPGDERRARALVGRVLEDAARHGHTAVRSAELLTALSGYAVPDPAAAMSAAVSDGQVLVFRDGSQPLPAETDANEANEANDEDADGPDAADVPLLLGLDRYALAEESLADGLVRLLRSFEGDDPAGWEQAAAAAPSASAAELIRAVAAAGLVVHTGGEAARAEPVALVAAARAAGLRAYAAAYTEDSRRRLAEALGDDAAVTVDALLAGLQGPGRAADGSLALDLLAVLDAPQLGVEEATDLVEAVADGARLILSGDPNALWSAGPGRAFADLLAAKCCPRISSRTPDPGPIGELVSCVGIGELAAVEAPDKEVVIVPVRDPREALLRTVQLVADSVPRAIGVPAERTQVITPAHGGAVGTRALNAALKERLNPGPGRFGGFDPGDRVVHVPFPGRTLPGTVAGAEPEGLRLDCAQGPVLVPRAEVAATVRHGWAITGHQAAGMRWPAVVVVVPGDAGPLLTRSWVYTAFGRGERHLSVVQGADQGLGQAVAGAPAKERTTRLSSVLRELAADE